jgi:hypothetical protein
LGGGVIHPADSLRECLRRLELVCEELNRVASEDLLPWSDEAEEIMGEVEQLIERMRGPDRKASSSGEQSKAMRERANTVLMKRKRDSRIVRIISGHRYNDVTITVGEAEALAYDVLTLLGDR